MYNKPLVIGVKQFDWRSVSKSVEAILDDLGTNTGNMMFTQSLTNFVSNAQQSDFGFGDREIEGRDCIIIAAANWINSFEDFGWLASKLERYKLPVILVGVGAQASVEFERPKVKDGTLRFLKLVSERSNSISTRGIFSAEVLNSLGIKNGIATGCPSMLISGSNGVKLSMDRAKAASDCSLHSTRHLYGQAGGVHKYLYEQAFKQQTDIILQSELADMYYALGRLNNLGILEKAGPVIQQAYGAETVDLAADYLKRHGKVFFKHGEWLDYMRSKKFCLGTRIHGTVASLLAGTPAVLITHDARTVEMADIMSIPYVHAKDMDKATDLDILKIQNDAEEDFSYVESNFANYYTNFMSYFYNNKVEVNDTYKSS